MGLEKENKELREKVAHYEGSPAAKFYSSLVTGLHHLTDKIDDKSLNFDEDAYAKSIFMLAKDADKIMIAMGKGLLIINQQETEPAKTGPTKKGKNDKALAV